MSSQAMEQTQGGFNRLSAEIVARSVLELWTPEEEERQRMRYRIYTTLFDEKAELRPLYFLCPDCKRELLVYCTREGLQTACGCNKAPRRRHTWDKPRGSFNKGLPEHAG